jgi:transposase-like protein
MPKGKPNKEYNGEFKQKVVEEMRKEGISYKETMRKYGIPGKMTIQRWERTYLEEGAKGLYIERRGCAMTNDRVRKGRPPKLDKKVEEDLIAENQRLRMEIEYLKKLNALVQKRELRERKRK